MNWDELIRLPKFKLIVVLNNNKPIMLDKMIYTEHPLAKKLKDSPVSKYKPLWNDAQISTIVDKKETKKQAVNVIERLSSRDILDDDKEYEKITFETF